MFDATSKGICFPEESSYSTRTGKRYLGDKRQRDCRALPVRHTGFKVKNIDKATLSVYRAVDGAVKEVFRDIVFLSGKFS
jgi:hypothetical protein